MAKQITLTIPDAVYQQAEQIAHARGQSVEEVFEEQIVQQIPAFPIDKNQEAMRREVAAFEANHAQLWQRYPNQYIAMLHGRVVDQDSDIVQLAIRIRKHYPDETVLIRRVDPELPRPLKIPSIRWNRK